MVLAITFPSPFLALSVLFKWSLPIPSGLFGSTAHSMPELARTSSPTIVRPWSNENKRSGSITVVEGRRSGDVWVANSDAIDGKNKISRAFEMLNARPKMSVLPRGNISVKNMGGELTSSLPFQSASNSVPTTPVSENLEEFGRRESKASPNRSGTDETTLHTARVMVAQKHYSALAMTVVVPPSPGPGGKPFATTPDEMETTGIASDVAIYERTEGRSHCRTRSTSSICTSGSRSAINPSLASPLSPTPPSVKAARTMVHKRSYSSGISMAEVDASSASMPLNLVPGLKIGERLSTASHIRGSMTGKTYDDFLVGLQFGGPPGEFSSPEFHSTPAANGKKVGQRTKKAGHERQHLSLPSLILEKDGVHDISTRSPEVNNGLDALAQERRAHEVDELPRSPSPFRIQDPATPRSPMATLINALDTEFKLGLFGIDEKISLDFDVSEPLAHSTPHNPPNHSPASKMKTTRGNRRSIIAYITSNENATNENTIRKFLSPSKRLAEISSRAAKTLPRNMRKINKNENVSSTTNTTAITVFLGNGKDVLTASLGGGLRPLSLLQDRDVSRSAQPQSGVVADDNFTRPLDLKKQKNVTESRALANGVVAGKDERENIHATRPVPGAASDHKGLKPLKLARAETSKQQATPRKNEVLPLAIVLPPSEAHDALVMHLR